MKFGENWMTRNMNSRASLRSKYPCLPQTFSLYKGEDQKFVGIQNSFSEFTREIGQIERVFVELIEFMEGSSEAQMLLKIQEIGEFLRKSFD